MLGVQERHGAPAKKFKSFRKGAESSEHSSGFSCPPEPGAIQSSARVVKFPSMGEHGLGRLLGVTQLVCILATRTR